MVAIMSGNRHQAAAVQIEWQFAAGTDVLLKVDSAGLNALQYCDFLSDQETKECIRNLEIAFNMVHQIAVPTRTIYFNEVPEVVDFENVNEDLLENISDDSPDSGQSMSVLTL
jgi:hypothetical protein